MEEEYRNVKGFEELYQVSNLGNIRSLDKMVKSIGGFRVMKGRLLKKHNNNVGYNIVCLYKDKIRTTRTVHQLVAESFLNHIPCGYKKVINHINFDKQDNRASNLEIVTQRENSNRKHTRGTSKYTGVYWNKKDKKWRSSIVIDKIKKHLGSFDNEIDAHLTYQEALKSVTLLNEKY